MVKMAEENMSGCVVETRGGSSCDAVSAEGVFDGGSSASSGSGSTVYADLHVPVSGTRERAERESRRGRRYAPLRRAEDWDRTRVGYRVVKRAFDIVFSLAVILVALVPSALLCLAIRLETPGCPLYGQKRVGRIGPDGKPCEFIMWKFRSMVKDADATKADLLEKNEVSGPMFKMADDPRVTRAGRFIRRHSMAPVIIGTPGDGEPTKSLSHPVNSSLDLHKCERLPEPFLVAQTHYTSIQFLSFAVFGAPTGTWERPFCACGGTSLQGLRAVA